MQGGFASGSGAGADLNANPDWRSQLPPDARQRIVNKILETLMRHLPPPVPEAIPELEKTAIRFEQKIYDIATSQLDYLKKISLKMLSMEAKAQQRLNPPVREGSEGGAGADAIANPDWRSQLLPDARQRIVNRIMETLTRHPPVLMPEGISDMEKMSRRIEQRIYDAASSQPDYLRMLSLKTLSMETKAQPRLDPPILEDNTVEKSRKCKICGDAHKRRNLIE